MVIMASSMLLCVHCRRLIQTETSGGYRGSHAERNRCEVCGEDGLVDPSDRDTAAMLQTLDESERLARGGPWERTLARLGLAGGLSVATVAVAFVIVALFFGTGRGEVVHRLLALITGGIIGVPMAFVAWRALSHYWVRTRALPRPARWSLARSSGARDSVVEGILDCDRSLVSPLSGKSCAAYEIGVRRDTSANAPLGTWLLLEQRATDLRVGDTTFPGSKVHLARYPRYETSSVPRDNLREFLRLRGLLGEGDSAVVFETLVQPGHPVRATTFANGVTELQPTLGQPALESASELAVRRDPPLRAIKP